MSVRGILDRMFASFAAASAGVTDEGEVQSTR